MIAPNTIWNLIVAAHVPGPAHAKLSPSSSNRWLTCTGSVQPVAEVEDKSSEPADEGTAAHALGSFILSDPNLNCIDAIGQIIPVLNDKDGTVRRQYTVDEEMATYVQVYVDQIRDKLHDGAQLIIEQRVKTGIVSQKFGEVDGTGDAIVLDLSYGVIDVNDLKYGKSPQGIVYASSFATPKSVGPIVIVNGVQHEVNTQLALYGIGAVLDYGWMAEFKTVRLSIQQPRLDHISVVEISVSALLAWADGVAQDRVNEIDTTPVFRPTKDGCQWCPVRGSCQALEDFTANTVLEDFGNVATMTDDNTVAAGMKKVALLKIWIKSMEERAFVLGEAGRLPGWKIVEGRAGNRKWKDADEVEKLFSNSYRLTREQMYNTSLISPTAAEKLLKKANPTRWENLQANIERGKPSRTLVEDTDPRSGVALVNEFGVV